MSRRVFRALAVALGLMTACGSQPSESTPADAAMPSADGATPSAGPLAELTKPIALNELVDTNDDAHLVEVSLDARVSQNEVEHGKKVELWTYNGSMPGPLLRANVGDRVIVHFTNHLPEPTTIHWHGLEVPAAMDGSEHTQKAIEPGASFDYDFVVSHAGTYWYHPHANSSEQVWRGLYAPLIVDDPTEPELGNEAVLVLDDIMFEGGKLASPESNGNLGDFFGREGDVMLVNGRVLPTVRARPGDALRFRMINAATSRYFRVALDGHELVRVGGDGGLLEKPEPREDVLLVPGERADIVVVPQGAPGTVLTLRSKPYSRFVCGEGCADTLDLMRIELIEGEPYAPEMPTHFRDIPPTPSKGAKTEEIALTQGTRGADAALGLNGQYYPESPLTIMAMVGDTQVWHVDNQTDYDHPFHLHGFRFQVLEQNGTPPSLREWKDTLNIPARSDARIVIEYDDRPGMWMFHCHILDHAKIGMMGMLHLMH